MSMIQKVKKMIQYYNEVVRLLLEICVLLLKAKREEIEVEELDEISKRHFNIIGAAEMLSKRGFVYNKMSKEAEWDNKAQMWVQKGWDVEKKRWKVICLKYSLKEYQGVIKKINDGKLAYIPEELLRGDYRDLPIRGKFIWGIGTQAIALVDGVEYHEECAHPRTEVGKKRFVNYKRNKEEAEKLANEILEKYGKR